MTDPYRGAARVPGSERDLESSPGWFYRGDQELDGRQLHCPTCGEPMTIKWAHKTPVRECEERHGLWIGAKDRDAFNNELFEPIARQQRIVNTRNQLAAVAAGDLGAVERLADRILSLERRIAALENRRS